MWKAERITPSRPPNEIIQTFYNGNGDSEINEADIEDLARKCNLTTTEVKMSIDHVKKVESNRKKGAHKAQETRRRKALEKKK